MSFQLRYIEEDWKTMAKGAALGGLGYMLADHFSDNVHDFNQDMHDTASKGAGNYWNSWMDKGQNLFDNLKVNNGVQPGASYQMTPEEMKNAGITPATPQTNASPESVATPQTATQVNNTQPKWPSTGQELSPTQLQASGQPQVQQVQPVQQTQQTQQTPATESPAFNSRKLPNWPDTSQELSPTQLQANNQHDLSKLKSVAGISNNNTTGATTAGTVNQNNQPINAPQNANEKIDINSLEKKYGYNNPPVQQHQTSAPAANQQTTVNQNQTQNTTHSNSNGFKSRYSQSDVDRAINMF